MTAHGMPKIRWDKRAERMLITRDGQEHVVEMGEGDDFVCPVGWVVDLPASGLRAALAAVDDEVPVYLSRPPSPSDLGIGLWPSTVSEQYWDRKYIDAEEVTFHLTRNRQLVLRLFAGSTMEEAFTDATEEVRPALSPLLRRERATLVSAEVTGALQPPWLWEILIAPSLRGRDVPSLIRLGESVIALLNAVSDGGPTRSTALDLLRSGRGDLLVGFPEGNWLEAKVQPYDLRTEMGQIRLARAVARFANAEDGGLIVIGMKATKVPGGEVINSIRPLTISGADVRRHQQAVETRVFPLIDNLTIEAVASPEGGSLLVIHVPPQAEDLKPFLVTGAIVDGKVEGAFISIVRRRGEASVPISASAIHAYLAAGRSLFRRGVLPPAEDDPLSRQ